MYFAPIVSIVIPTRNYGATLELCLASIYNQNYNKTELTIYLVISKII